MWDQFNKQNLAYSFKGPIWQLLKKHWHVNSVFFTLCDNSCSVDLISQSTHYYRKQYLTAVLRACATTLQAGSARLAIPSPPYLISMQRARKADLFIPSHGGTLEVELTASIGVNTHFSWGRGSIQKHVQTRNLFFYLFFFLVLKYLADQHLP